MSDIEKIQLFENKKVRTTWDEEKQEWFFSIVDICGILTEQPDYDGARKYWKVLKGRLISEGFELVSNCYQLKMVSPKDGKKYNTDVADMQQAFRIIQSIPSKKAEPFKRWLAQVGAKRIHQFFEKLVKANPKYCSDSVIDLGWSPRQIVVNYTCRIGVDSLYL